MPSKAAEEIAHAARLLDKRERANHAALLKEKDKQIELLSERLEKLKSSRWSIPMSRRKNAKSGRPFVRVCISDTHGCFIDPAAFGALLGDLEAMDVQEVVWQGDHVDCGGFLAEHHVLGSVPEAEYTFEKDCDSANDQLDRVQTLTKNAVHHMLMGNHEDRISKWIIKATIRNPHDGAFLEKQIGIRSQLNVDKRGIHFYASNQFHQGIRVRGSIKLGHCYFTHGFSSATHSTSVVLKKFAGNVVFGHVHRSAEYSGSPVSVGTVKAWSLGCLCQLQPMWKHTDPSEWNHGYGLQLVMPDGFMHIQVPIVDGKSYLIGLKSKIGA